jgi:transposase
MLPQTSPTKTRVSGDCVQGRASGDGQRLHDTVRVRHQRGVTSPFRQVIWRAQASRSRPSAVSAALQSGIQVTVHQCSLRGNTGRLVMMVSATAAAVADPAGARCRLTRRGGAWKKRRLLRVDGVSCGQLAEWGAQPGRCIRRVTLRSEGWTGGGLLPRRWVATRTWAWRHQSRRLRKDEARLPQRSEAMIDPSMAWLRLRQLPAA